MHVMLTSSYSGRDVPHRSGLTICVLAWREVAVFFLDRVFPFDLRSCTCSVSGCTLSNNSSESGYFSVVLSASAVQWSFLPTLPFLVDWLVNHAVPVLFKHVLSRGNDGRMRIITAGAACRCAQLPSARRSSRLPRRKVV